MIIGVSVAWLTVFVTVTPLKVTDWDTVGFSIVRESQEQADHSLSPATAVPARMSLNLHAAHACTRV